MFFLSPEIDCFFSEIGDNLMPALGRKQNTCFFNARPKSNARAHLKQRKKHSGLSWEILVALTWGNENNWPRVFLAVSPPPRKTLAVFIK